MKAVLASLVACGLLLPDDRPAWEAHPTMECRGTTYIQCSHVLGTCVTENSTLHIIIDHPRRRVEWVESDNPGERIVGRTFARGYFYGNDHIESSSTVYLSSSGGMITFGGRAIAAEESANPDTFPAALTRTGDAQTFVHRMRCRPHA